MFSLSLSYHPTVSPDFGVDELVDFASDCNFPWLMSNVYDKTTKRPLAEGETSLIIEWNGHKVNPNFRNVQLNICFLSS